MSKSLHWLLPCVLLCVRVLGAFYLPIIDCDETYNYWEPLHRLMYGYGFQTWEYAPMFALRSYFYLLLHALPAWPFTFFLHKKSIFYLVRTLLALTSAYLESRLSKQTLAPNITLWLLIWSPGMFQASSAFLPSSFVTLCLLWILTRPFKTSTIVIGTAIASLLGWPFAALLGLPSALFLVKNDGRHFLRISVITFLMISTPMLFIDSYMYGQWVYTPFNLVQYNLFENKSVLYGVESFAFYFKNLLLNWSFAFPMAILYWLTYFSRHPTWSTSFFLWFAVFLAQPHKEERFLFPMYPFLALGTSECLRRFSSSLLRVGLCVIYAGLSLLRIIALVHYYGAPLHLDLTLTQGVVCLGPDWYSFPGHFFVPSTSRLAFFPFTAGELPHLFDEAPLPYATRKDVKFNGMNRNDPLHFKMLSECNFFVGAYPPANVSAVQCVLMLDSSHTSSLNRVLYHPFHQQQTWHSYCLYKNVS